MNMRRLLIHATFALLLVGLTSHVGAGEQKAGGKHQHLKGVVVEKGGALAVEVPNGGTYQLNENRAQRHGHEIPKAGDEVTVVLDENNLVMEIHPKGTEGTHRFVTGNVVSIGTMQREITLKTDKGEQRFPMEKQTMTPSIKDGALVTAELNEAGSVIDLHPAQPESRQ
jgi:hypothetical protein